jgi:hypothetical protein
MAHLYKSYRTPICRAVATAFMIATAFISAFINDAKAMTFYAAPPLLYLGGGVVPTDWAAWEEAMITFDGKITTIVFHDSSGGDSMAGRKIGNDIRRRQFSTVVSGRCSSACANMFLGGITRQYAATNEKNQSVLGYHGSYSKTTKELNRKRTPDYFIQMTDGKMSEEFVQRFISLEKKSGLLRFYHRDQRTDATPLALLCKGDEDRSRMNDLCEKVTDADALSTGVITTWEALEITKPPAPTKEKITVTSWQTSPAAPVSGLTEYQGN